MHNVKHKTFIFIYEDEVKNLFNSRKYFSLLLNIPRDGADRIELGNLFQCFGSLQTRE